MRRGSPGSEPRLRYREKDGGGSLEAPGRFIEAEERMRELPRQILEARWQPGRPHGVASAPGDIWVPSVGQRVLP